MYKASLNSSSFEEGPLGSLSPKIMVVDSGSETSTACTSSISIEGKTWGVSSAAEIGTLGGGDYGLVALLLLVITLWVATNSFPSPLCNFNLVSITILQPLKPYLQKTQAIKQINLCFDTSLICYWMLVLLCYFQLQIYKQMLVHFFLCIGFLRLFGDWNM